MGLMRRLADGVAVKRRSGSDAIIRAAPTGSGGAAIGPGRQGRAALGRLNMATHSEREEGRDARSARRRAEAGTGRRRMTGHREEAMGTMMGASMPMYGWIILWTVLGAALLTAGGFAAGRFLHIHAHAGPPAISPPEPPKRDEAQAALRQRYARGEISREEYLQAKVELED